MQINKIKSFKIELGYAISIVEIDGVKMLAVGTEGCGAASLLSLPDFEPQLLCQEPGGTMSILNVPGTKSDLVSIMEFYSPFKAANSGVYYHQKIENTWKQSKIIDLPFVHRLEWMNIEGVKTLMAASVSKFKENPSDWSQPGTLYAATLDSFDQKWKLQPIIEGIVRNHGMLKKVQNGDESLFITGQEGVFRVFWDKQKKYWANDKWLDCEVSEIAKIDIDGDGVDELVTIEPFHGTKLAIYKFIDDKWVKKYETDLAFGHGLSAGFIEGKPTAFVGNRAAGKELLAFQNINLAEGMMERIVVEAQAGPTQTLSLTINGLSYLISSNQHMGEVSLYQLYN